MQDVRDDGLERCEDGSEKSENESDGGEAVVSECAGDEFKSAPNGRDYES